MAHGDFTSAGCGRAVMYAGDELGFTLGRRALSRYERTEDPEEPKCVKK